MPFTPEAMIALGGGVVFGVLATIIASKMMGRTALSRARRESAQTISDAEREAASILKE